MPANVAATQQAKIYLVPACDTCGHRGPGLPLNADCAGPKAYARWNDAWHRHGGENPMGPDGEWQCASCHNPLSVISQTAEKPSGGARKRRRKR